MEECPFCRRRFDVDAIEAHVLKQHEERIKFWRQSTGRTPRACKSCGSKGFAPKYGRTVVGNEFLGCEFCCDEDRQ